MTKEQQDLYSKRSSKRKLARSAGAFITKEQQDL